MKQRRRQTLTRCLAALIACCALILAACGTPDPNLVRGNNAGAKPNGNVLFAAKGDIYLWNGSSSKKLTNVGDASGPRWSNDGKQFIYVRTGEAFSDLWVANADGGNPRQLTHDQPTGQVGTQDYVCNAVWALDPVWSPVDDTIAYISDLAEPCNPPTPQPNYLWLMSGLGNHPSRVAASTVNQDDVEHPSFSPDGRQIVFDQRVTSSSNLQRSTEIFKVNLDTGTLDKLASGNQGTYAPAWSPDGKWVAYVERTGTANDLWVVSASGGQPVQLTTMGNVQSPAWTSDSSAISFFVTSGLDFKAEYVTFSVGTDGKPRAGKPQGLFSANGIDAVSGMSWSPAASH